ncbi:glycerophosphodiester phosphodiesterase [Actinomadura viridis]|uniref:glycerophosphodiester phosphodiesterase n=1 Tax=Actinomadura viridis TaxID=58110 RepID=A0A931DL18_9ACTN|nr:glycerophosphodiester phosphodiesterase family protein [Actinomadura viridis]MBG6090654.1 glycerophosphoryl diester phosphodiesterase [Actinomadura viridis]
MAACGTRRRRVSGPLGAAAVLVPMLAAVPTAAPAPREVAAAVAAPGARGAPALDGPAIDGPAPAVPGQAVRGEAARRGTVPIVVGHRGAPGHRPEHTLASYELAVRMRADYIEPDVVPTKDGHLVARHENEIGRTTDVARHPEFARRRTTKTIDGRKVTGWFTEDFTLAELRTLRAVERMPGLRPRNTRYDRRFRIPTVQEVVDLAGRLGRRHGRRVGIFPEVKHPTYFRSIGLPLEGRLAALLRRNGLNRPDGRVIVQSFEPAALRRLDRALNVTILQSIAPSGAPYDTVARGAGPTFDEMVTPEGLKEIGTYADWIAPEKGRVIPLRADGSLGTPTSLVPDAHAAGLKVAAYTFRDENRFLPADLRDGTAPGARGRALREYDLFYRTGIDGLFSDHPGTAVLARTRYLATEA